MTDAVQGVLPDHEAFKFPFKVEPEYEEWKTSESYLRWDYKKELPEKLRVWRVQNVAEDGVSSEGVVARSYQFGDSPDAEIIAVGFNVGKESGAMGIGRHGNFLQWGFSAEQSKMTLAGKALFVNCICYIRRFEGKRPLVRKVDYRGRESEVAFAKTVKVSKFDKVYPNIIGNPPRKEEDLKKLKAYYVGEENYELLYFRDDPPNPEREIYVDEELRSLGILSNRKPETLKTLISLLRDPQKEQLARKLLARYTDEKHNTPEVWEAWLKESEDRIFFSDVGGFKFFVMPKGYLELPPRIELKNEFPLKLP